MKIEDVLRIAGNTTKNYVKAQVILFALTLVLLAIGFAVLDVPLWFLVAIGVTILDLLPVVGVGIVMIPWAIICFIMGNFSLGGGLLLLYTIQIIVRQIAEPLIVGKNIGLRPLVTFAAMLLGGLIFGPIGLICGPLVAAIYMAIRREQDKENSGYIDIK